MADANLFSNDHHAIIKAFKDRCFWIYELYCAVHVMERYQYPHIAAHMNMLGAALGEYYLLHVCKLLDSKRFNGDDTKMRLSVDYIIEELPWKCEIATKIRLLRDKMLPFVKSVKPARHSIIAHDNLQTAVSEASNRMGAYKKRDEEQYMDALLEIMNTMDMEVYGDPPIEWPSFPADDAQEFVNILEKAKCAVRRS